MVVFAFADREERGQLANGTKTEVHSFALGRKVVGTGGAPATTCGGRILGSCSRLEGHEILVLV